eukprot:g9818.t1
MQLSWSPVVVQKYSGRLPLLLPTLLPPMGASIQRLYPDYVQPQSSLHLFDLNNDEQDTLQTQGGVHCGWTMLLTDCYQHHANNLLIASGQAESSPQRLTEPAKGRLALSSVIVHGAVFRGCP